MDKGEIGVTADAVKLSDYLGVVQTVAVDAKTVARYRVVEERIDLEAQERTRREIQGQIDDLTAQIAAWDKISDKELIEAGRMWVQTQRGPMEMLIDALRAQLEAM